jgi:hypothetical protein
VGARSLDLERGGLEALFGGGGAGASSFSRLDWMGKDRKGNDNKTDNVIDKGSY